jgi:hypothetical protein
MIIEARWASIDVDLGSGRNVPTTGERTIAGKKRPELVSNPTSMVNSRADAPQP